MSTPVLEKVSVNIPLQQEYYDNVPCNSGFPFDRDDQEGVFRSQLDDLAKRHPELAEHFEGYPFHDRLRRTEDPEFRRFRERPFGSRFEGFGFPFEERSEPHPHYDSHEKQETPQPETSKVAEEKEVRKPQNLQQSNTVDLGQQQEPEVDDRGQRSMSAPPENNSGQGQRFVSSVNIPIMRDAPEPEHKEQGHSHSQQPQERVIPIMVEGRDEPVIPKNVHQTFGQPTHKPSQSRFGGQPETIFGHQPGHFTKFVHPAWGQHEDMFYQQKAPQQERAPQAHPQRQEQAKAQPSQHSQQQHAKAQPPQQKVPQPQPQQQNEMKQPSPPPQPKPLTPIEVIQGIQKEVMELMTQVEQFTGKPKDKQYLYLDEMLTRNMIKLDNVDTQGQENVRSARKEAIKCIEKCLSILDAKAKDNLEAASAEGSTSQTESLTSQPSASSEEKMEVEKVEEKPEEVQKDKDVQEAKEVAPEPMEVEKEEEKVEVKSEESTSVMEEAKDDDEVNESTEDKKEKKKGKKKAAKS